jgi:DNA-binding response OmpR family regulator
MFSNVQVIPLSAHANEKARQKSLESGADEYLVKPFLSDELRAFIAVLILVCSGYN